MVGLSLNTIAAGEEVLGDGTFAVDESVPGTTTALDELNVGGKRDVDGVGKGNGGGGSVASGRSMKSAKTSH